MNAPDQREPGPDEPGFDDTFDHFFSKRPASDPDATRPVPQSPQPGGPDDATAAWSPADRGQVPPAGAAYGPPQQTPQYGGQPYAAQGYGQQPYAEQPYAGQPYAAEPAPRERRGVGMPMAVIGVSLIVIAIVAYIAFGNLGSSSSNKADNPAPLPQSTGTASPSAPDRTSEPSPKQSTSPDKKSTAAQPLPDGALNCHSDRFSVGPKTSCPFGKNVAKAAAAADFASGSATLKGVYSPTTHDKYTLTCTKGGYLTCVSKTGAIVYVKNP